jgi:hypothetical protein
MNESLHRSRKRGQIYVIRSLPDMQRHYVSYEFHLKKVRCKQTATKRGLATHHYDLP